MDSSSVVPFVEHASKWTWEGWFAGSVFVIVGTVAIVAIWGARKHDAMMKDLAEARKEKNDLFREMITNAEKTNGLLAVALDRNTHALGENSRILERIEDKL